MLGVSKRCSPRPKAQEVLLTWARASAREDRAVEYPKLAGVVRDLTVRSRFIAFPRQYRSLAQVEGSAADETASQEIIDSGHPGSFRTFAFVLLTVISGATTITPFDFGRASDCLAAPNSPAPKGSHWYYHLDRTTQQKCWYVRSSERPPQRAMAQTTSTGAAVPLTSTKQIDSAVTSEFDGPSGQLEPSTKTVQNSASNKVPTRWASQAAPQENIQRAALQENASSDASGQMTATTSVVWPDPPPMAPSVTPREANATALDAPVTPVSDTTDNMARNDEQTKKSEIPIAIFPALAFGLVVIGLGVRFLMNASAAGPTQTIDNSETVTILDNDHVRSSDSPPTAEPTSFGEDDFLTFVSAVSGRGPLDRIVGSVNSANDVSGREARLARLREDIGQRLGWARSTQHTCLSRK
jgi:hypothetical protein